MRQLQRLRRQVYRAVRASLPQDALGPLTPLQRATGFGRFLVLRFLRARSLQAAGSLTFTTLLALVPLFTLALGALSALPASRQLLPRMREFLQGQLLPDVGNRLISSYMTQFSANAGQLRLAGMVVLVTASVSAMLTVDRVFAEIWRVRRRRPLARRLVTYWALLVLGPLAIAVALTLSVSLVKVMLGLTSAAPSATRTALRLVPWLAITAALATVYRLLPQRHVPWSHALAGGLFAGVAFETMKWLFSLYVHHFRGYTVVYGAFAAFPIFLLWIWLSWAVVLAGAVLTASLSHWHREAWRVPRSHPDQRCRDALQAICWLMAMPQQGARLRALQQALGMGFEDLDVVLEALELGGLVACQGDLGWSATAHAWRATVGDVWSLFHRGPAADSQWAEADWGDGAALREVARRLAQLPSQGLDLPLARLVEIDRADRPYRPDGPAASAGAGPAPVSPA